MIRFLRGVASLLALAVSAAGATVPVDLDAYRQGPPVDVSADDQEVRVLWKDEADRNWAVAFRRDPAKPLIASVTVGSQPVLRDARPYYSVETGVRRKGWNAFFDYPPAHPDGTVAHTSAFDLDGIRIETVGNRVRVHCGGLRAGSFEGSLVYTIFAGSRLVQQEALVSTDRQDVAFLYDAGLEFAAPDQLRPGKNMRTPYAYYDTEGQARKEIANGFQPERVPHKVRYRVMATAAGQGSVAVFPAPHQYFFPRDFTSNLSQNWHRSWRGRVSLGVRQIRDTNWQFYPLGERAAGQRAIPFRVLPAGRCWGPMRSSRTLSAIRTVIGSPSWRASRR